MGLTDLRLLERDPTCWMPAPRLRGDKLRGHDEAVTVICHSRADGNPEQKNLEEGERLIAVCKGIGDARKLGDHADVLQGDSHPLT
jgi:hypothetical protein